MKWGDAVEKFGRFAEPVIGGRAVAQTVDRVASLEEAAGLAAVFAGLKNWREGGA